MMDDTIRKRELRLDVEVSINGMQRHEVRASLDLETHRISFTLPEEAAPPEGLFAPGHELVSA